MEFDKSKVYTTLNADELKIGSKVIVANDLGTLKQIVSNVTNDTLPCEQETIKDIKSEFLKERFVTNRSDFGLCYLISEPEEKKLKWTDLKVGDVIRHKISGVKYLITGFDERQNKERHVRFADEWVSVNDLGRNWEKVEK